MTDNICPREGEWYQDNIGRVMPVVVYDEDNDAIEVQLLEGEVAEFDLDSRNQLDIELIDPPEDWSGPFDDLGPDDMGNTEKGYAPHRLEWSS
jgi:hypothetical protein